MTFSVSTPEFSAINPFESTPDLNLTVDTLVDENDGDLSAGDLSLREAIAFLAEGGTINFAEGLMGTIVLDADLGQLLIDKPLTIEGTGAETITVSGDDKIRVFYLTADAEIQNLTIANGNAEAGGGIYGEGVSLTILNSTFRSNKASGEIFSYGGAIYSLNGDVVIKNSLFDNNTATGGDAYGGGIYSMDSGLTVNDSTFRNNHISASTAEGGGIYIGHSTINNQALTTINDSIFEKNRVDGLIGEGGAVFHQNGVLAVNNSTFNDNVASGEGQHGGGGIANQEGNVTLSNSTLNNNVASGISGAGGGIYSNGGNLTIDHSVVSYNQGDAFGGGVSITSGKLTVSNSLIEHNSSSGLGGNGGGIYGEYSPLTIIDSTIRHNTAYGTYGGAGGGIHNFAGDLALSNSTINNNGASSGGFTVGGGIYTTGDTIVSNSTISGNTVPEGFPSFGGGIYNERGVLQIRNSTLTQNMAPLDQGSGVANSGGTVEVVSSIIAGNTNSDVDSLNDNVFFFVSQGNNLIGTGNATSAFIEIGDTTGITNPGLEPLADNGGVTQTHALKPNSPAWNGGSNPDNLETDQRGAGFERVIDGKADIGAFEVQSVVLDIRLYDAKSDTLITTLQEGDEISASALLGKKVTIAAFVPEDSLFSGQVDSIFLNLNDGAVARTENAEPYSLFGDFNNDFHGGFLPVGDNTITFDLYSQNNRKGNLLGTLTRNFTIVDDLTKPLSPVAWWSLDETSGSVADDRIGDNIGILQSNPVWGEGKINGGLAFNGNDSVRIADNDALDIGMEDFSVAFWIKTSSHSSAVDVILDKRIKASGPVQGYAIYTYKGELGFQLADGQGHNNYGSNTFIADDNWHQATITVDRDSITGGKWYVDGVEVGGFNPTSRQGSLSNSIPLTLGRRSDSPVGGYFKGTLDEVQLFNKSLTADEVQSLFSPIEPDETNNEIIPLEIDDSSVLLGNPYQGSPSQQEDNVLSFNPFSGDHLLGSVGLDFS